MLKQMIFMMIKHSVHSIPFYVDANETDDDDENVNEYNDDLYDA